jgi:hypothetical protein
MNAKKNNAEVRIPKSVAEPVHVELYYPNVGGCSSSVTIGVCSVAAIDNIEVRWNHNRMQWEIYRDVHHVAGDGFMGPLAEHVLLCAIPAWTEPSQSAEAP